MQKFLKLLVALIGLFCAAQWLLWSFAYQQIAQAWAVSAVDAVGANNLRGDIGGMFLATGVFCALYFRHGPVWLKAAAIVMACVALGRAAGFAMGDFAPKALASFLVELVFISVFLGTAKLAGNNPSVAA